MIGVGYSRFEFKKPNVITKAYYADLKYRKRGYRRFFLVFWNAERVAILGMLIGLIIILFGWIGNNLLGGELWGWLLFFGMVTLCTMTIRVGLSFNSYLDYSIAKSKHDNTIFKSVAQSRSYKEFLDR